MLAVMNDLCLHDEKIISSEIPALIDSESFLKTALNSKHVSSFLMWQNWRHFVPMKKGCLSGNAILPNAYKSCVDVHPLPQTMLTLSSVTNENFSNRCQALMKYNF